MKLGYNDIDGESYHKDREYVSSSGLKLLLTDPRTFYKKYVKEEPETEERADHLNFGSYVHSLVLEPHLVEEEYAIYAGTRRGKEWETWKEENEGKIAISTSQKQQAFYMVEELQKNPDARALTIEGEAEKTLCVELDGVKVKVRADYKKPGQIIDVKTTGYGCSLEEVQASCMKWGYDLSAALYVDSFTQFLGEEQDFYFIFMSKKFNSCEVYKASKDFLENGRQKYKKALALLKESRESGIWYNRGITELTLP